MTNKRGRKPNPKPIYPKSRPPPGWIFFALRNQPFKSFPSSTSSPTPSPSATHTTETRAPLLLSQPPPALYPLSTDTSSPFSYKPERCPPLSRSLTLDNPQQQPPPSQTRRLLASLQSATNPRSPYQPPWTAASSISFPQHQHRSVHSSASTPPASSSPPRLQRPRTTTTRSEEGEDREPADHRCHQYEWRPSMQRPPPTAPPTTASHLKQKKRKQKQHAERSRSENEKGEKQI